jgi:hypothetical protein
MAKTRTKSMQLDSVEEILIKMFAVVASIKNKVSDIDGYSKVVKSLLDGMISEAASGGYSKFVAKTSVAPDFSKIYVFAQCTPDLTDQQCTNCLEMISSQLPLCCIGKEGGRFYTLSCNFRLETFPFFDLGVGVDASLPPSPIFPSPMPLKGAVILT